jgi:hypothetical protein
MVIVKNLGRGVTGLLVGTSVVIVGLAVVPALASEVAKYILILGIFTGCLLAVYWGLRSWSMKLLNRR